MEHAFAEMKSITLPRAGGTEQQSEFVCVYQVHPSGIDFEE